MIKTFLSEFPFLIKVRVYELEILTIKFNPRPVSSLSGKTIFYKFFTLKNTATHLEIQKKTMALFIIEYLKWKQKTVFLSSPRLKA